MKVTLTSTTKKVFINGIETRIWEGETETGVRLHAYIVIIGAEDNQDLSQFQRDLEQCIAPSPKVAAIPLRLIL